MNTILLILIGITIFTFIYFIFINWNQLSLHIQFLNSKFSWFGYLIFIVELFVLSILYYYVIPYFFSGKDLIVSFLTIYTVTNFSALFLSWLYFNSTHCWRDEANGIAQKLYYLIGEDLGHFVLLVLRLIINFFVASFLINGKLTLEPNYYDGFKTIVFFYSFNCAIYTVELISNIISNFYGESEVCRNVHYLCKTYNIACDVPSKLRDQIKMKYSGANIHDKKRKM